MIRRQSMLLTVTVLLLCIAAGSLRYYTLVTQTVYEESVSHLRELLHQTGTVLNGFVEHNMTYLHMRSISIQEIDEDEDIQQYLEKVKEETGYTRFYFLSREGRYITPDGVTGNLGLEGSPADPIKNNEDFIMKAVLPGQSQLLVFISPRGHGSYRGFSYDAIALAYDNESMVKEVDTLAYDGTSGSYVVHGDGRVVINNGLEREDGIYNWLGFLREHVQLSEKEFTGLTNDFKKGQSGSMRLKLNGTDFYMLYEPTGIEDWMLVAVVPTDIVNKNMNKLQFCTILLVGGIFAALGIILILMVVRANGVKLKRKNTELLYRDELFTKLSRNVDDIFMMLDIVSGKPDYVSPNIERLLGISVEEVLHDVHVLDKLHPEDTRKQKVERLEGIQNEEQREWDFEYIHQKTRERRWFHIVAMRSEVEGRSKYIFVMSDRTEDKKVNQALEEAAHAAEAANRAKSTFLSNISHDIRTPMNAISGFTTLAIRSMDQKEKVRDYLAKIQVSGDHLMSLINDVLDMSRIESGRIHLEESEVKLPEVLSELETITSGHVQAKQLKLSVDAGEIANETICCDKTRLNQILLNLLSNAIKFTPVGGRISVRLRQLPGTQENKTVCGIAVYEFRVKDNGIGMSPEFIKKIFDPFERERTSTVSRFPGTGLGMSISKNLVEMMGGTIEVQSEQGKGTEFMIRIPMRVCSGEKSADHCSGEKWMDHDFGRPSADRVEETFSPMTAGNNFSGRHVLLVEDNELNREIATAILREYGFEVDTAENGAIAVEKVQSAAPDTYDIVLMDVLMPVMDGYEATRRIRALENPARAKIRILAMTANAFEEDRKAAFAVGMDGFLSKPIDIDELWKTLRRLLQS